VAPPQAGDESYDTYISEKTDILSALKQKAELLGEQVNKIPGMSLSAPQGAMYAFDVSRRTACPRK
jgi:alanine transaminase